MNIVRTLQLVAAYSLPLAALAVEPGTITLTAAEKYQSLYEGSTPGIYRICNSGPGVMRIIRTDIEILVNTCADTDTIVSRYAYKLGVDLIQGDSAKGSFERISNTQ